MTALTLQAIAASSDEELFALLGQELGRRIANQRGTPAFLAEIQGLPVGLRAMAATYELDVSLALDDLGWHFGNWLSQPLTEETARGLDELEATELAEIFRAAWRIAETYWSRLATDDWGDWYPDSPFEQAMEPLNQRAWSILEAHENGIFHYWVTYARKHPDRLGVTAADGHGNTGRVSGFGR
jgi:hypothetical protein